MNRRQADRTVIAARAAQSGRVGATPSTVGTNPAMRRGLPVHGTGPVRRTRCAPLTAMQRDSTGARSAWAASPYYFTDPKWGSTVSTVRS